MNRSLFCWLFLGLGSVCFAQDLTKKISVDIPASKASSALAALGKAAGINMEPAANVRNDVFVISAHDATVDEIMQKVAQAESGKWIQQSGTYFLTRESSTSVAQERAEIKARADAIAKAIAKLNGSVAQQSNFDQAAAQKLAEETKNTLDKATQGNFNGRIDLKGAPEKTPTARAIARLLASIDPARLAQIGPNQRVVFSTQATSMQLPLNGNATRAINQFVTEQQLYSQAYNTSQPQEPGNTRMVVINSFGTPTMGAGDPKLGLGVGLVVVQRRFEGTLDVQILAADTKYETIATGSYGLQIPRPPVQAGTSTSEEPLKISDEAKEMAKALGGNGGGGSGRPVMMRAISISDGGADFVVTGMDSGGSNVKLSLDLRAKILNPEKYEPLAFVPGEAMLALSRQAKKNLVALLPDYCFGSMTRQFANEVTASQLLGTLEPTHSLLAKQDESWIVVSPEAPATGRVNTVNRPALGTLLRSLDRNGTLRLDDVADFAVAQSKVPSMGDFDILYPRLINDASTNRDMLPLATGSYSLYKLYGTLSTGQRQNLGSGQQMPFMNLSSQQTALIADILYNSQQAPNVQLQDQTGGRGQQQQTQERTMTFSAQASGVPMPLVFGGGLSAKTERTIVMPNGVVNDGFLLGSARNQPVAQGINSQTGSTAFFDASSLAFSKNSAGQPELAGFTAPQYDKYRMGHQMSLSIRFMLSPRVMMMRSLNDTAPDANAQAGPYESLPADFRQRVDQAAQQLKGALDRIPGRNQNTPPPPSR